MFVILASIGMGLIAVAVIATVALMAATRDQLTVAVISDLLFYSMVGFYIVWSMFHDSQIDYEVIFLTAIVGGVLPTMSTARIISKGRR
ncbi:cation:proton antiporter [Corynebacterium vitaeruminis]|uniref:Monovalent cation/H+ antiporter subunit F n=1 Tax=Corynebacterium vitaeruminis DSM 20294 TaxID=1224164 RepID=W5XYB1_9CORY|nr:cation:proton antiporter [Corynebacterium vitaeruminis]AHI21675.1 monovalent cation/H+ antiporter subunit F [Corynebacterium vitaeruminis DSM 20294]